MRLHQTQGRGRRCDALRKYAHDSSGCRFPSSVFGQFILASRHFPSQTFCNCHRLSGAAPSPLRSIMARSDVGLLGTDLIPSGPFFAATDIAATRRDSRGMPIRFQGRPPCHGRRCPSRGAGRLDRPNGDEAACWGASCCEPAEGGALERRRPRPMGMRHLAVLDIVHDQNR